MNWINIEYISSSLNVDIYSGSWPIECHSIKWLKGWRKPRVFDLSHMLSSRLVRLANANLSHIKINQMLYFITIFGDFFFLLKLSFHESVQYLISTNQSLFDQSQCNAKIFDEIRLNPLCKNFNTPIWLDMFHFVLFCCWSCRWDESKYNLHFGEIQNREKSRFDQQSNQIKPDRRLFLGAFSLPLFLPLSCSYSAVLLCTISHRTLRQTFTHIPLPLDFCLCLLFFYFDFGGISFCGFFVSSLQFAFRIRSMFYIF